MAGLFKRSAASGSLILVSKVGRLYSSTLMLVLPPRLVLMRHSPRRRPEGISNSPEAVPKASVVAVTVVTTW